MIAELLRLTLTDPRAAARRILAMDLPAGTIWTGFALVMTGSLFLSVLANLLLPIPPEAAEHNPVLKLLDSPVRAGLVQAAILIALAGGIAVVGRWFGGQARFDQALTLVAWTEFVLLLAQIAQLVLMPVLPPFGALLGFAAMGLFLWLTTVFTAEVNGFDSLGMVFLGLVAGFLVAALVSGVLFVFLGLMPMPQPAG